MIPKMYIYILTLLGFAADAICGFWFGMWQDNYAAGLFMFMFCLIMQPTDGAYK